MTPTEALTALIEAIDATECFPDLEGGCGGNGVVVQACRAINMPIPPNLAAYLAPEPEFGKWLDELNAEASKRGYADAATMWQDTGAYAWEGYYEDGLSPADALTEDEASGAE